MEHSRVYVAMSGGVDSAGAALLLQELGYDVTGVTLRLRPGAEGDIDDARRAAQALGVPHEVLDCRELFRHQVMDAFVGEYCRGRTPNPCLVCNRRVKFGALLDYALDQGADYLATGHYARLGRDEETGRYLLLRGRDRRKDQSYVLYQLTQRQLAHLLLPIGTYEKATVRSLAAERGLISANRPDSQDICFIPDGDYVRFLQEYGGVKLEPGDFVDRSGRVLGRHRGLVCYTTGQRKGLGVSADRPLYVLEKDAETNRVILGDDRDLFSSTLTAEDVNWISIPGLEGPMRFTAKTRSSQREAEATVEPLEGGRIRVRFDAPQRAITAGQAVVLYDGERVAGGGTIVGP